VTLHYIIFKLKKIVYHQRNSDEVTGGNPCNIKTYNTTVNHAVSLLKIHIYKGSKFRLWVLTNI
jgi:hypothetical protein